MYRTTDCKFWTDPKVHSLRFEAIHLYHYLFTNPHTHFSGIYYLPRVLAVHESKIPDTLYDTLCGTLSQVGLAYFDTLCDTIFIPKMLSYQAPGKKNFANAIKHSKSFKHSKLYLLFCECYNVEPDLPDTPPDTVPDTLCHTRDERLEIRDERIESREESIICSKKNEVKKNMDIEGFMKFWHSYPTPPGRTKGSKKDACAKWGRMVDEDRTAAMKALPDFIACDSWKGGYIPMVTTFLNQALWQSLPGKGCAGKPSNKDLGIIDEESYNKMINLW